MRIKRSGLLLMEIRNLCSENDLSLTEFSQSHIRIKGAITVDCWPNKMRAWVTGSSDKSFLTNIHDLIELAKRGFA